MFTTLEIFFELSGPSEIRDSGSNTEHCFLLWREATRFPRVGNLDYTYLVFMSTSKMYFV